MDDYWCSCCTWTYVPERGDPTQGVPPGTLFEDLPDDWRCPICFNEKDGFIFGQ